MSPADPLTKAMYFGVLKQRYRSLRFSYKRDVSLDVVMVGERDERLREMRMLAAIAKFHGVDVKLLD